MSLDNADPPLPGSSCESATISMTAGRAINPLDPSELSFPKVAVLGLAEDSIALRGLLFFCSSCTHNKPAVSPSSVELLIRLITCQESKLTSRGTLSTKLPADCTQPRRKDARPNRYSQTSANCCQGCCPITANTHPISAAQMNLFSLTQIDHRRT